MEWDEFVFEKRVDLGENLKRFASCPNCESSMMVLCFENKQKGWVSRFIVECKNCKSEWSYCLSIAERPPRGNNDEVLQVQS